MQRVVLPKLPISALVTLFGGDKVNGEFFVTASSPTHEGAETLLELLNDNTRWFVPFQADDGMLLLNRESIRTIEFDSPDLSSIFTRPDNDSIYALMLILRAETSQQTIQGFCFTGDLRPETQRPVDLLNARDMFLLVYTDSKLMLCNKNAISHATVE